MNDIMEILKDLESYIEALKSEYLKHYPEKGDGWKKDFFTTEHHRYSSMPPAIRKHSTIDYLIELYDEVYKKWKDSNNIDELIDMGLIGGFIWMKIDRIVKGE